MLSIRTSAQAKTFAHYLITYLCISLSIIFLLLPIYIIAYQNAQRIITQEQSQRVAEGFWGLQSALKDCQTYAYNMSSNTDINRIRLCHTNDKDIPKYLFNMFLFQQKNIWVNNVVQEVIIQFKNNDALLTRSSVYQDKQYFYKKFFNYGNLSYDQWQKYLFEEQKFAFDIIDVNYKSVTTKSITINYYYPSLSLPSMVISFIIPTENIINLLLTDEINSSGTIELTYGTNSESISIKHNSNQESVYDLTTLISLEPPISVKAGLSQAAYSKAVSPVYTTLLVYIISSIIIAIILSILFTYLNMKPIKIVMNGISQLGINTKEEDCKGNAYSFILQTITGISQSEKHHQEAFSLAQRSLEHTVFSMAMKGLHVNSEHLELALGSISVFIGAYILVGISKETFTNDWPTDYDPEIMMVVSQRLFKENAHNPYIYQLDKLYIILNLQQEGGENELIKLVNRVHSMLVDKFNVEICIGVSKVFTELSQLSQAADQVSYCLLASRYGIYPPVASYEGIKNIQPEQITINEGLLYSSLTEYELESEKSYYNILLDNVFSEYHSSLYAKTIYYNLLSVCQKILSSIPDNEYIALREYDNNASIRNNMNYLRDLCNEVHKHAISKRSIHKQQIINKILEYINENYSCSNLNLAMVSDHFSLSERYLSSLIREQTGKNYADYILEIRIEEARRLLSDSDMPINDIAKQVGYDLPNSFYKTFKNYTGLSPSQYREHYS